MKSNLKLLLEQSGHTVEEFARYADLPLGLVRRFIGGSAMPSLQDAYVVARVLDVPVEDVWPCEVQIVERHVTIREVVKP